MFEVELFKKLCFKIKVPEDKYITQCFITSGKTGTLDISNYTPSVSICEIISQVLCKSVNVIKLVAKDSLLPAKGLGTIMSVMKKTNISELNIAGNNISSETLPLLSAAIQGNSMIKVLNLKWNNIGVCKTALKSFGDSLSKNTSLEYLDLRNNQITTEGAKILAKCLISNSTIKKIDLRWNLLDNKGAECLLDLMETNYNVGNILLAGNPIAPEVVSSLGNCTKYKEGLKAIQSSYEAKLNVLTKHIKEMENKRIEHVDQLCKDTKKHIHAAELKINDLTCRLEEKETHLNELQHKLKETEIILVSERIRTQALESMISEKETNYLDLNNTYQKTIENFRQELVKLENDVANRKMELEMKVLEEKTKREQAENQLEILKKKTERLKEDIKNYAEELEENNHKKENIEEEKKNWQSKYLQLEKTFSDDLQRLTKAAAERQRNLEKNILDLTENQAKNMEAVSEKLEICFGEKATLEAQLTGSLATISRLQHENSDLINQLAQPSRRLAHVLEELTDEKVMNEKLRQEKHEIERKLEESRRLVGSVKEEIVISSEKAAETLREQRQQLHSVKGKALILVQKLKERDRLIEAMREEERKRAKGLYTAVTNYMEHIPTANAHSEEQKLF